MENLDQTIDTLARNKMTALMQENGARLTRISLRHTTANKRNSIEYMDEIIGSYEKLLSAIPKGILNVEKSVRTKYRVLMDEQRRLQVSSYMGREIEQILAQLVLKYRNEYLKKGQVEMFDKRIELNRASIKNIGLQVAGLMGELKSAFEEKVLAPGELSSMYGLDEVTLVNMQLIVPLQKMNNIFNQMRADEHRRPAVDGIQESLSLCVKVIKRLERGEGIDFVTPEARKSGKLQIAKASMRFKDLVLNTETLLEQLMQIKESRNLEIIQKTWQRILDVFKGQADGEVIVSKAGSLYELFELER